MSRTRLNRIYQHMKERCYNKNCISYERYGGRGITICDEWNDSEIVFRTSTKGWLAFKEWALSHGYQDNLTIDRIDNNLGYSPNNCRWVTSKVQNNNRRCNHLITYNGITRNLREWCEILGLDYDRTERRLNKCHLSIEDSFKTGRITKRMISYKNKTQSLADWCRELGLNYSKIVSRLNIYHWSIEKAFETK